MTLKNRFKNLAVILAVGLAPVAPSLADTLYDGTSIVQNASSFTQSFTVTTPGVVTVTLSDISWLDSVTGLSSFLSTTTGVLGSSSGTGSQSYNVSAGTIYAHWFGEAQGTYDMGVLGVNISFQAISSVPVPLPTSLVLMLSGLGLLFGWQSRKSTVPLAL